MSELKAVHAFDVYEAYTKTGDDDAAQVYLKSEADKAISELEESHKMEVEQLLMEIVGLKETLNNSRNARKYWRKEYLIEYKECSYQKYKRCLAMAEMCDARYDEEDAKVNGCGASWEYISKEMKYWERWHNRWLTLADKYKEGNV